MKRVLSAILVLAMVLPMVTPVFAEEEGEAYYTVNVEYTDNIGHQEQLRVMVRGINVYVDAKALAERLGYSFGEDGESAVVSNTDMAKSVPFGLTRFEYGNTHVSHMVLGNMVDDYEAPFASLKNGEGIWIPLEYSLLLLDSGLMITDDALLIDSPTKKIEDYFTDVIRNSGRYDFDWEDDFGYSEGDVTVIGSASHLVNVFNGALGLDGASWALLFQQFAGKMDSYDEKYGEKLAMLLSTEADKELQASVDKVGLLVDILGEDGTLGTMLSNESSKLDSQIGDLSKKCEEVLRQVRSGNSPVISYNRSYQALEDAFDKQTWVSDLSNATGKVSKFLDVASKAMEVAGFEQEFKNQDEFSLAALMRCLGSSNGFGLPNKMEASMAGYSQSLSGEIGGYMTKRLLEKAPEWIADDVPMGEVLGTQAAVALLAWNIASKTVPFISNGLSGADSFELALYALTFQYDAAQKYRRNRSSAISEGDISAERLYELSQFCYIYLKSCYVAREAAIDSLAGKPKSIREKAQPLIDEQNGINAEMARIMVELKGANETNDGLVFGFLLSDNKDYLNKYDDGALIQWIESHDLLTLRDNSPESNAYRAVLEEWRERIEYDKTVEGGRENDGGWRYSASPRYVSLDSEKVGDGFVYCYTAASGFDAPMLVVADPDDGYKVYGCYQYIADEDAVACYTSHFRYCKWLCEDGVFRSWSNAAASASFYKFYWAERPSGYMKTGDGTCLLEFTTLENFNYGADSSPGEYTDSTGETTLLSVEEGLNTIDSRYPAASNAEWHKVMGGEENRHDQSDDDDGESKGNLVYTLRYDLSGLICEGGSGDIGGVFIPATMADFRSRYGDGAMSEVSDDFYRGGGLYVEYVTIPNTQIAVEYFGTTGDETDAVAHGIRAPLGELVDGIDFGASGGLSLSDLASHLRSKTGAFDVSGLIPSHMFVESNVRGLCYLDRYSPDKTLYYADGPESERQYKARALGVVDGVGGLLTSSTLMYQTVSTGLYM